MDIPGMPGVGAIGGMFQTAGGGIGMGGMGPIGGMGGMGPIGGMGGIGVAISA
jgi:hypothetical protein